MLTQSPGSALSDFGTVTSGSMKLYGFSKPRRVASSTARRRFDGVKSGTRYGRARDLRRHLIGADQGAGVNKVNLARDIGHCGGDRRPGACQSLLQFDDHRRADGEDHDAAHCVTPSATVSAIQVARSPTTSG